MKKFFAFLLTFAMLFSLAMPAMAAEGSTTIYFDNTAGWAAVNAYAFDAENNVYLGQWPGTAMTYVEGNIWSVAVSTGATTIIFNDGANQTADLTIPTDGSNLYTYNSGWSAYTSAPKTEGDVTATFDPDIAITGISYSGETVTYDANSGNYVYLIPAGYSGTDEEYIPVIVTINGKNLEYAADEEEVLLGVSFQMEDQTQSLTIKLSDAVAEGFTYENGSLVLDPNTAADGLTMAYSFSNDNGGTWSDPVTLVYKQAYAITNNTAADANGTITVPEYAIEGDTVAVTVTPNSGYALDTLTVMNGETTITVDSNNMFEMPAGAVTVTATFKAATSYDITVNTDGNGTIASDEKQATAGTTVTLTVTPATGYVLDALTVNDGDVTVTEVNDTTYTFVMPEADVTVSATFRQPAAEITGVTITIDGTVYSSSDTSEQNPAVITPSTQSIVLTVSGKDFAYLNEQYSIIYTAGISIPFADGYGITIDVESNTASVTLPYSDFTSSTESFELKYCNGGDDIGSGVYIIYQDNTEYSITLDENIANGALTANPTSATAGTLITLTWTADAGYAIENITVTDSDGSEVGFEDQGLTKWTFIMPASNVNVTATFYKMPISSVEITWGSMSFTYDDSLVDGIEDTEVGWKNDGSDGAGSVTVKNISENGISMTISYTAETGYTEIEGYFYDASQNINYFGTASADLDAEVSKMFELYLEGKPEKAIPAGTKIGVVTIVIESSESNTEQGSDISVPSESA